MQNLAAGVGDLKRVLTNVKARGVWGEIQLGSLLEDILAPDQYKKNVRVKPNSSESVEYAIRLPGSENDSESCVWLPVDSKFPQEDYLRLLDSIEAGDAEMIQKATAGIIRVINQSAKDIKEKYIFHNRFRNHVSPHRGPLCRGAPSAGPGRKDTAEVQGSHIRSNHSLRSFKQPAHGISDTGTRKTFR
jgi:DNA anti-recombination protein RmuC